MVQATAGEIGPGRKRGLSVGVVAALTAGLAALGAWPSVAAARVVRDPVPVEQALAEAPATPPDYVLVAGDRVAIRFAYTPELDVEIPIRPDGKIALPLVGEVSAAGLTVQAFTDDLLRRYATELADPDIAVMVLSFSGQRVHVGGEVGQPGVLPLIDGLTVLDAIFQAGGFKPSARLSEVVILRRTPAGKVRVIPVDLRAVIRNEDVKQDLVLQPLDAIFVPRTRIANMNKWMNEYIYNNLPLAFRIRLN